MSLVLICRFELICTDGCGICKGKYLLNTRDSVLTYLPSCRNAEVRAEFIKNVTRQ